MDAEILWTIPSYFRYNNNMKNLLRDILRRKIIVIMTFAFISSICISGCRGEQEKENPTQIRVAVIDTGISTKAIPEENISEGMNYVDTELSTEDTYGHGTAVASIILSEAPNAQLVPLVSNVYEDGKIKQVENDILAEMIRDAIDIYDCQIINLSAGLILDKDSVRNAVGYAEEQGVLVVASAGNDYEENGAVRYYPAAYDSVLAVGSLVKDGKEIAPFSQRGEWVDTYVVGEGIPIKTLSGNEMTGDGTSYSAAKVTGMAAKELEDDPTISLNKLKENLVHAND